MLQDTLAAALQASPTTVQNPAPRGALRVRGPDAVEFLHRICSQDVEGLAVGACAPACFLSPKGKLVALGMLARADAETLWVETAAGSRSALAEYLERFHFTERLEIDPVEGSVAATAWGSSPAPGADAAVAALQPGEAVALGSSGTVVAFASARFGVTWRTVVGPAEDVAALLPAASGMAPELADCLRLASAQFEVGRDTDDNTLALEAPVEDHVSTDKGCYTGQEIVARIHTYGHVNRRIVALRVAADGASLDGASVVDPEDDDEVVGRLSTVVALPEAAKGAQLALAYVPREFAALDARLVLIAADGARCESQVVGFGPA